MSQHDHTSSHSPTPHIKIEASNSSQLMLSLSSHKTITMSNPNPTRSTKFARSNPKSDRFPVRRFHHIEFYSGDATNVSRRFSFSLGLPLAAKSDLSTGNTSHASYLIANHSLRFLFSAPYSPSIAAGTKFSGAGMEVNGGGTEVSGGGGGGGGASIPTFTHTVFRSFTAAHGLAVRAIAIEVSDADLAFSVAVKNGARPSSAPIALGGGRVTIAEVELYGDVVLRFVSYRNPSGSDQSSDDPGEWFLPGFVKVEGVDEVDFGIRRLDHAVGNVPELAPAVEYVKRFTGFHEFAEFSAEDVGTSESGLNSVVLANNDEMVLLPLNEPVYGTKRKSQIQTYLEHNEGAGVQHLALMTEDIFRTLREMRRVSRLGGFEFMPGPPGTYYRNVRGRVGQDVLSDEQIRECEELGILVDRDDQGTLLQIFTKPVGDRPTIFIEIIQRVGCMLKDDEGKMYQKGGCGGFGKGNFSELFKSIEEYEKTLEAARLTAAA